jgi:hypothetical protein
MSSIVALSVDTSLRSQDWIVAGISLLAGYFVVYPLYVLITRWKHTRRIKKQLVTTSYKLPQKLTPTELAFLFSTRVGRTQLYATLLDLSNRSILDLKKKNNTIHVDIGPKVEESLASYEQLLVTTVEEASEDIAITRVIDGPGLYKLPSSVLIKGSKQYVFWWLLRDTMQRNNIIRTSMLRRYITMLLSFGLLCSFLLIFVSVLGARMYVTLDGGELIFGDFGQSIKNSFVLWSIMAVPSIIVSYFLLRFRGRMLGRYWLLTAKYERYLAQLEAYREFVRLTHKGKLHFDSKTLEKESLAQTRPYAIAFGYAKKNYSKSK